MKWADLNCLGRFGSGGVAHPELSFPLWVCGLVLQYRWGKVFLLGICLDYFCCKTLQWYHLLHPHLPTGSAGGCSAASRVGVMTLPCRSPWAHGGDGRGAGHQDVLAGQQQLAGGSEGALASWRRHKVRMLARHGLPISALAQQPPQCVIPGSGIDWILNLFLRQANLTYIQYCLFLLTLW